MQPSNTVVESSAYLRQAFSAMGILVGLAIVVPLAGIVMVPAVALGAAARGIAAEAASARARAFRPSAVTPAHRRAAPASDVAASTSQCCA